MEAREENKNKEICDFRQKSHGGNVKPDSGDLRASPNQRQGNGTFIFSHQSVNNSITKDLEVRVGRYKFLGTFV